VARPRGLPFSSAADRPDGVSETFGTIRYGRSPKSCCMTFAGPRLLRPERVYVDLEAEKWLKDRMAGD